MIAQCKTMMNKKNISTGYLLAISDKQCANNLSKIIFLLQLDLITSNSLMYHRSVSLRCHSKTAGLLQVNMHSRLIC